MVVPSGWVVVVVVPSSVVVVVEPPIVVVVVVEPGIVVVLVVVVVEPPTVVVVVDGGTVVVVVDGGTVVVVVVVGGVVVVGEVVVGPLPPGVTLVVPSTTSWGVQFTVIVPMWVSTTVTFSARPRLTLPGWYVTVPVGAVTEPLTAVLMTAPETSCTVCDATLLVSVEGDPPVTPMPNEAFVAVTDVRPNVCAPLTSAGGNVALNRNCVEYGVFEVALTGTVGAMSIDSEGCAGKFGIVDASNDSTWADDMTLLPGVPT